MIVLKYYKDKHAYPWLYTCLRPRSNSFLALKGLPRWVLQAVEREE